MATKQEIQAAILVETAHLFFLKATQRAKPSFPLYEKVSKKADDLITAISYRHLKYMNASPYGADDPLFQLTDKLADVMADVVDHITKQEKQEDINVTIAFLRAWLNSWEDEVLQEELAQKLIEKAGKIAYFAGQNKQPMPVLTVNHLLNPINKYEQNK